MADAVIATEVVTLRASLPVALRTLALDACLRNLSRATPLRVCDEAEVLTKVGRWTDRLLRQTRVTRAACLIRSLVRYRMLNERGVPARFVMGVRDRDGQMQGHAWVELRGQPVMEREDTSYYVTFSYP